MRAGWPAFIAAPLVVMPAAHATTYLTVEQAQHVLFPGASFTPVELKGKVDNLFGFCPDVWFTVQDRLVHANDDTKFKKGDCCNCAAKTCLSVSSKTVSPVVLLKSAIRIVSLLASVEVWRR